MDKDEKSFVIVCQYGGMKFIRYEALTHREALDKMNILLEQDKKRKGRGARLSVRILRQYGAYSN